MTQDYADAASLRALLPDNTLSSSYDTILALMATRASRAIDSFLKREPGAFSVSEETTRYFDGSGNSSLFVGEMASVPSKIEVAESGVIDNANGIGGTYTEWDVSDFMVHPRNALAVGSPILRLDLDLMNGNQSVWYEYPKSVKITSYFGFTTTANLPDEISLAANIQGMRYFKRAQQAFADVGTISSLGQMKYVQELDPDVRIILSSPRFQWLSL